MIIIWIVFAFFDGSWHEMTSSFADKRGCENHIYGGTTFHKGTPVPAVCRERSVPAPPN